MFVCSLFSVIAHVTVINNNINDDSGAPGPLTRNQRFPGPLTDNQEAPGPLTDKQGVLN